MISVAASPQPPPSRSCAARGAVMEKKLPGTTSSLRSVHSDTAKLGTNLYRAITGALLMLMSLGLKRLSRFKKLKQTHLESPASQPRIPLVVLAADLQFRGSLLPALPFC